MMSNCNDNNMVLIFSSSSTTNERPPLQHENQVLDEKMVSSTTRVIEKPTSGQEQPQHGLNCPRCDSTNTKFCYYNNYSLSQPRHFCKACKRYWTRGGTLRNAPVGSGCRKNKRSVKNPNISSSYSTTTSLSQTHMDISNRVNPMFYGLQANKNVPSNLNPGSFSRLNPRGLGLQAHEFGLGFSTHDVTNPNKQIQIPDSNSHLFGAGSSSSMLTMASLLASSFHQQKLIPSNFNSFQDVQIGGNLNQIRRNIDTKQEKVEGEVRMDWNNNQIEQIGLSDPSLYNWSSACYDQTNMGSSVPSLI